MIDGLLVTIALLGCGFLLLWISPEMLRYLATRMWARAHAIEVARAAYAKTVKHIEGEPRG